jgi:TctA family transporter
VLFGLLLNTLGLVLCLLMLIGISSYASHEYAWKAFFAGCVATLLLAAFAVPLAQVAFKFGPAEYFSLMVLGMIGAVVLASGSLPKAIAMICLGLLGGMVLGFVLRPMMEENFRRSPLLSRGDFSVFFTRPLPLALLIATAALIVIVALPSIKSKREEAFQEE